MSFCKVKKKLHISCSKREKAGQSYIKSDDTQPSTVLLKARSCVQHLGLTHSLTHDPGAPSDSIAPPAFLLCRPQHKRLTSRAQVDTFSERIGVRSRRPGFYPSATPAVLGGFPTVLGSPGFRSLHGNWAAHSAWLALRGLSTWG